MLHARVRRAGGPARRAAGGIRLGISRPTAGRRGASDFAGWDELWERLWESSVDVPGPLIDRLAAACRETGMHCAIGVNEREAERPGTIYNTLLLLGPDGPAAQAPQADADPPREALPRDRRRRRPRGDRDAVRPGRRTDLLGEPHAAGPLRGLQGRAADLDRAYRRRLRRLAGVDAPHRDRVRRLRRLGAPVHPAFGLPGRLPRAAPRGQGGIRQRRGRDHRARPGRGDRRAALRRGGHRHGRLRPRRRPAREALVRRRRPLQPRGRSGRGGARSRCGRIRCASSGRTAASSG